LNCGVVTILAGCAGNLIFDFCGTKFSATMVEHDTSNGRA